MSRLHRLFWLSLLVKLLLSALIPLTNDEAYYWVWSRHLQLSYYDHPPMVAWLYWLGNFTAWFPGSVRWPGVLLGHLGLAIWLRALGPHLDEERRRLWLWLMLLSPLVGGSALVVTPDLPLMFFYGVALWVLLEGLKRPGDWRWALALGLAMGAGFSGKYMMVLFPLSLLPVLPRSAPLRRLTLRQLHWIVLGGVAGALPVWLWNLMNDMASLKFQAAHGLGRSWKPSWTLHYVLLQFALISPVVLLWAWRARRRLPPLFSCLAWTPLLFFFLTTFRGYVEANWPIAAYPFVFALAAAAYPRGARGVGVTLGVWAAALALLAAVILARPEWASGLKVKEFHQFDAVEALVAERRYEPIYARSYQMAAKLHFELGRPVYKLRGMNRKDFYDYMPESEPTAATYYLIAQKDDVLPLGLRTEGHKVVEKTPIGDGFEVWKVERP